MGYSRYHHGVIHDCADQASNNLNGKSMSWGQVDILSKLEITCKQLAYLHSVVSEASEVKVREWFSWKPEED